MKKDIKTVRYQVLGNVFVNGSLIEPKGRKDIFVMAVPGLEGPALKLAPEKPAEKSGKKDAEGDGGQGTGDAVAGDQTKTDSNGGQGNGDAVSGDQTKPDGNNAQSGGNAKPAEKPGKKSAEGDGSGSQGAGTGKQTQAAG